MDKVMKKSRMRRQEIKAWGIIFIFYAVMELSGITCPILFLTGISCAGCGMSRAWLSLLRLDFSAALSYHPLFWLPVPAVLLLAFRRRLRPWIYRCGLILICTAFLVVYIIRMVDPADPIVTADPSQGFRYLVSAKIYNLLLQ